MHTYVQKINSKNLLTKSLCKSFDNILEIFIKPTNTKNRPNKIDNDFSTIQEPIFECFISIALEF